MIPLQSQHDIATGIAIGKDIVEVHLDMPLIACLDCGGR